MAGRSRGGRGEVPVDETKVDRRVGLEAEDGLNDEARSGPQARQILFDLLTRRAKSIDVRPAGDDELQVEIRGVDIFDPNTGSIRSSGPDDIACWFIDTDYNGEAFFVRHAYFLGTDDPYKKLRNALRADIDEASWDTLHSAVSRPFPKPLSGRIAIKVINHYGDEVLKIYEA